MSQYLVQQLVPITSYKPRLYLNGFPKAGLHFLELMMGELVTPSKVGHNGTEWLGTFGWHSWTSEWIDLRTFLWRLSCLERGDYLKGHCGHKQEIEYLMWYANIGQIFIYRDLRDVAVSQAHHILSDQPNLVHAHKDFYRMLGGFDEVLSAVIEGIGPYPGILERWELYAPWLEVDWVLKIKFEDMKANPDDCASAFLNYSIYNATHLLESRVGHIVPVAETKTVLINAMVGSGKKTILSTTFRKGEVGGWKEAFKPEHINLFKKHDKRKWLVKLGYEESGDWS